MNKVIRWCVFAALIGGGLLAGVVGIQQWAEDEAPAPLPVARQGVAPGVELPVPTRVPAPVVVKAASDEMLIPAIPDGQWSITRRPIDDGQLVLDGDVRDATLWSGSTPTSMLVSAHVRNGGEWGPMKRLSELTVGAEAITRVNGEERRWRLVQLYDVPKSELPKSVWGTGTARLTVVTCGGKVVNRHYDRNVVAVFMPGD